MLIKNQILNSAIGPGPPQKTYHNIPGPPPTRGGLLPPPRTRGRTSGGDFCLKHLQLCKDGSGSGADFCKNHPGNRCLCFKRSVCGSL